MKRWQISILLLAAAATAYFAFDALFGPAVEVATVLRRDVVQSVVASGRVSAPYRVDIGSQIVGTVAQVPVAEGQAVKAGQVLIALESTEVRAEVKQAEVALAQADLARLQLETTQPFSSDIAAATAALVQARASLQAARAKLAHTVITSPWDGTLIVCDVKRGELVRPGKVLMVLSPAGDRG